jgi:hypothetical protein
MAREGSTYHVRVSARHPITHKPAPKVAITGELLLEDDDSRSLKLHAAKNTDSEGYALLDFVLPPRFPQFPHTLQPAGGEVKLVGRRGAVVAEAEGEVLVDQFARTLITSDKPIYQPGQTMHVRALMFTPSRRALANQNIVIKICDPENIVVFRNVVTSSRFGIATADWPIPENTRLGDYRILVGVDGEDLNNQQSYNVRISRYDLPNFSVSVEPDRGYYLPGRTRKCECALTTSLVSRCRRVRCAWCEKLNASGTIVNRSGTSLRVTNTKDKQMRAALSRPTLTWATITTI